VRVLRLVLAFVALGGCGDDVPIAAEAGTDATSSSDATSDCDGPFCVYQGPCPPVTCTGGLCLRQICCDGAPATSISGVVHAPNGTLPIAGALVYVPNGPLAPFTHGPSLDSCSGATVYGNPLVSAVTDAQGHFTLANMPSGADIPIVVQAGKWRRRIAATIAPCVDNPLPDSSLRLPVRPGETSPDDDMPAIAIATGADDALECTLRALGVDASQFTPPGGTGRVHLWQGEGGATLGGASASSLWASPDGGATPALASYDMLLLACEGADFIGDKPATSRAAIASYANGGGWVLATHAQGVWIEQGPGAWPSTAVWNHAADPTNETLVVDQGSDAGALFAQWLLASGASSTLGAFDVARPRHDVDAMDASAPRTTWAFGDDAGALAIYSFSTPLGVQYKLGRVLYADLDVSQIGGEAFPSTCASALTPEQKAFAYFLFDHPMCAIDY
jgi:hypothetical protein